MTSRSIGPVSTASSATLSPTSSSGLSNEVKPANATRLLESVLTQEELQHWSSSEHHEIVDNRPQQAPIQLTLKELISIAPDICKELCKRLQAKPITDERTSESGPTKYHEPLPPQVPLDDDDNDDNYDYEAAVKALYQMDDGDAPTPPNDDNNDYGAAIADLYQTDDETPLPPRITLSLHNATAIAWPSETLGIQHKSVSASRKDTNTSTIIIQEYGHCHIVKHALYGTQDNGTQDDSYTSGVRLNEVIQRTTTTANDSPPHTPLNSQQVNGNSPHDNLSTPPPSPPHSLHLPHR
ncbi:hypothetical protein PTI98_002795 [Pleurotus ostreatus]|nr:hypothetical protein PTI98_002795 [Pleurotus ostreatus]